jgi:ATP-dependent Lon protease
MYSTGTLAKIIKLIHMPDGSKTAVIQGVRRFELIHFITEKPFIQVEVKLLTYKKIKNKLSFQALIETVKDSSKKIIELSPNIPNEAMIMLKNINTDSFLLNFISSNINIKNDSKQKLLEMDNLLDKAELLLRHMDSELQLLELKDEIESKVRGDIDKQQRDYLLNQQLRTIQEELGGNPQEEEIIKLEERAKKKVWALNIQEHFSKELNKVRRMNPQVAEYSIQLNYLELLLDLPWEEYTKDNFELDKVRKVLDIDHFGLEDVKDRIIEHLAVLKLKGDMKAPILCLVGPPGVGKTSLGKSIATALGRKYIRMSLGGLHDESEIRGHRKTYIGALPGRIVQSLKKAGSGNPVFILDEIDKLGKDFRGDPSSALLEVLDPEQNSTFYDNYLELEYDLSKVMFIATANSLESIQPALLDRMEIIRLSGYSVEEKVEIANQHLIPERREEHGLKPKDVTIPKDVVERIIQDYTREAGVRSLDRTIAGVMRHIAKNVAMDLEYNKKVKLEDLKPYLGSVKYTNDLYENHGVNGVAVGLAWTQMGGDILFIEAATTKGNGKLILTGNLGDVMKESATTALSYLKSHYELLSIDLDLFEKNDIHIHVPEGAIPKDGPSAGITMMTAIASALIKRPVRSYLAMTGEITLRGRVLPVGGIKEKVLAAKRAGITDIIVSKSNLKDVEEINQTYLEGVEFHYVDKMEEVIEFAFRKR